MTYLLTEEELEALREWEADTSWESILTEILPN